VPKVLALSLKRKKQLRHIKPPVRSPLTEGTLAIASENALSAMLLACIFFASSVTV